MSSGLLRISLVQTPLYWEDKSANLAMLEEKIWPLKGKTDLIVLPEMFSTGFTMSAQKLAETLNGNTHRWLKQMAAHTGAVVCGSCIIKEAGKYYNRMLIVYPDGTHLFYDKKYLFPLAAEELTFTAGTQQPLFLVKDWRILPQICYDLRFPESCRNSFTGNKSRYDLIVYCANWPEERQTAWTTLLKARAIENLCYSIGVNIVGEDGLGKNYNGYSACYNAEGKTIIEMAKAEAVQTFDLFKG